MFRGTIGQVAEWLALPPYASRLASVVIPDIPVPIKVHPIGSMTIRLKQHRSYWLKGPLTREAFMLGALKRLIRPGDVVYDVGANIGLYTRFIAHFGASRIIAFEPKAENRKLLSLNVVGLPVEIIPLALADRDGEEDFQVDDVSSYTGALDRVTGGLPSVTRRYYGLPPLVERVSVARLDGLQHLSPPNLIKIDVEGAEALVLGGASRSLQRHRPRLVIEMHDAPVTIEVIDLLIDAGYVIYGVLGRSVGDNWPGAVNTYRRIEREDRNVLFDPSSPHPACILASTEETDLKDPITPYP